MRSYVTEVWICEKCGFILHVQFPYGAIIGEEICPIDGTTLKLPEELHAKKKEGGHSG